MQTLYDKLVLLVMGTTNGYQTIPESRARDDCRGRNCRCVRLAAAWRYQRRHSPIGVSPMRERAIAPESRRSRIQGTNPERGPSMGIRSGSRIKTIAPGATRTARTATDNVGKHFERLVGAAEDRLASGADQTTSMLSTTHRAAPRCSLSQELTALAASICTMWPAQSWQT
jgi:hypothetical protein